MKTPAKRTMKKKTYGMSKSGSTSGSKVKMAYGGKPVYKARRAR